MSDPLRVNKKLGLGAIPYSSERANLDTRRSAGHRGFEPSYKPPGTATVATHITGTMGGYYHTGMGETRQLQRQGSDHSHIKSFGNLT